MMKLEGKRIAVLVTDGFEHSELTEPVKAIKEAGGEVDIIAPGKQTVKSWKTDKWGEEFSVDCLLEDADSADYDGLLLPGGVLNPDQLRKNDQAVAFVKKFFEKDRQKPVAAICHGPWTLINAGVVKGRDMTAYASLKQDLINAGAKWHDEPVVVDNGLITSRNPGDLQAFNRKIVEEFSEGVHKRVA